jgi:hypothetical protein
MKKRLAAVAVSAAFLAPAAAFAQAAAPAAPAVPTLDKIFEASGLSVNGWIDTAYSHADRDIEKGIQGSAVTSPPGTFPRVFDNQNNSFVLHQVGLQIAKQPKEGFGGLVNVIAGKDAQVIHSFPETSVPGVGAGSSMFDITQAYAQYATGPLTVIGGKFVTLAGTEVIASTGNTTFSRSILFGAVPFTHTGLRATYAMGDMVSLTAGVNNGWDQLQDANRGKTVELGATITPIKPLSLVASYYSGSEPTGLASQGNRELFNFVGTWTISDAFSVGLEYLTVTQKNATVGITAVDAKYDGWAGYFTWNISQQWRLVLRGEEFNDKNGFHFNTIDPTTGAALQTKYKEGTVTLSYLPTSSVELRGEVRQDKADNDVYVDSDGTLKKNFTTYALQAIYKF